MATWQYKSVYLKIHPQPRDAAPKPGKLVVASPAMIEPLVPGQEQRLLSDYLDHQGSKGWELFSILPDPTSDRGPCFVFRRSAAAIQPAADLPTRSEDPPTATAAQVTAGLKPPPGVTQPVAPPPAQAPAQAPAVAAPAPAPAPARAPMPSSPSAQAAIPPLPVATPAPPPRGSAPSISGAAPVTVAAPQPSAPQPVAPPPRTQMPSHSAMGAPAGPPPLPAANVPAPAPAPVAPTAAQAAAAAAAAHPVVPPPMTLAARGSAPSRGSSPHAAQPAPQAPVVVPPLAPPNPAAVKQPPAQPAAPDYTAILLQAVDLGARGNPQGWAEMSLVTRTCAQSGLSQDQVYELLEYLATNRVVEWSPSSQTPKRGGWVRRAR